MLHVPPDKVIGSLWERRVTKPCPCEGYEDCWVDNRAPIWSGHILVKWSLGGRQVSAYVHQIGYHIVGGASELKVGQVIRHLCGVPGCWNPGHLVAGSRSDNARDMALHGTAPRGGNNGRTKLQAFQVRAMRKSDHSHTAWANHLGVHSMTVRYARTGKNWGWLEEADRKRVRWWG